MKTKMDSRLIPGAAELDKTDYIAYFVDRKGFIERTLKETSASFGKTLDQAARDVNFLQSEAGKAVHKLAAGEKVDLREVMAAVDKARASFNQLTDIRNKMMEAYREILKLRK
jgi:flagellar hook-basal body complex protein FliE